MKDTFKKERTKFERWVLVQFPDFDETLLKRNTKHEYINESVSFLFVGFCGGLYIAKIK